MNDEKLTRHKFLRLKSCEFVDQYKKKMRNTETTREDDMCTAFYWGHLTAITYAVRIMEQVVEAAKESEKTAAKTENAELIDLAGSLTQMMQEIKEEFELFDFTELMPQDETKILS